jgi:quinol monooxygenase YgiN
MTMFAVIYRFKLKANADEKFKKAWAEMTFEFRDIHGGLGSCLHKTEEGIWLAYARWPNREAWQKQKKIRNQTALYEMKNCVEERLPEITMDIVNDLLFK